MSYVTKSTVCLTPSLYLRMNQTANTPRYREACLSRPPPPVSPRRRHRRQPGPARPRRAAGRCQAPAWSTSLRSVIPAFLTYCPYSLHVKRKQKPPEHVRPRPLSANRVAQGNVCSFLASLPLRERRSGKHTLQQVRWDTSARTTGGRGPRAKAQASGFQSEASDVSGRGLAFPEWGPRCFPFMQSVPLPPACRLLSYRSSDNKLDKQTHTKWLSLETIGQCLFLQNSNYLL